MRRRASVGLAILVTGLLGRNRARAGAPGVRVRLDWVRAEGAESCPSYAAIADGVRRRLGRNPFAPDAPRSIEGVVGRENLRWVARIYVREANGALEGTRELESEAESCDAIAQAVTLSMALAIDPEAAMRVAASTPTQGPALPAPAPPAPPAPLAPPALTRATPTAAAPARDPQHVPRTGASGAIVLYAAGTLGVLPTPSIGIGLAGDVFVSGRVHLAVGMLFLPEVHTASPDDRFAFGLTSGVVRGCVDALQTSRVSLSGCGGAWVGGITALEPGRASAQPGQRIWLAAGVDARFAVRLLGPLTLDAGVGILVPITRYRFFVEGSGRTVFEQPFVAGNAHVGLGVHFR